MRNQVLCAPNVLKLRLVEFENSFIIKVEYEPTARELGMSVN